MKKSRDALNRDLTALQGAFNRLLTSMIVIVKKHGETEVRDEDAISITEGYSLSVARDDDRKITRYSVKDRA